MHPFFYRIGLCLASLATGNLLYAIAPEVLCKESECMKIVRAPSTSLERVLSFNYDNHGRCLETVSPNGVKVQFYYDFLGQLSTVISSDGTINYLITRPFEQCLQIEDCIHKNKQMRLCDNIGNVVTETFSHGRQISASYNEVDQLASLHFPNNLGEVRYTYNDAQLTKVTRLSHSGEILYTHEYKHDEDGAVSLEQLIYNLGAICYSREGEAFFSTSPYSSESGYFCGGNLLLHQQNGHWVKYTYDRLSQLISNDPYDSNHNPYSAEVNSLNELLTYKGITCNYDLNGNLILKKTSNSDLHFTYDALDRLIVASSEAVSLFFTYDLFGRRLSKTVRTEMGESTEYYLYHNQNELLALDEDGSLKELRIPGTSFHPDVVKAIAIETPSKTYAPIYNLYGNIAVLVETITHEGIDFSKLDPFGTNLYALNYCPWVFASKRYDSELNLVYFGHRYYDPELKRWMTPDPLGLANPNPYVYALNNPVSYIDPDGRFAFAIPVFVWGASFLTALTESLIIGAASWGAYHLSKEVNDHFDRQKDRMDKKRIWRGQEPPYNGKDLGLDPSKSPGEGWQWQGPGIPGNNRGAWVNRLKRHSLHPDLDHPGNVKPHWDLRTPEGDLRLYTDGTYGLK